MIRAVDASLEYSDHGRVVHACKDVSIEIRDNEFLGILGPSGSGKSSLLYLLSGLKQPTSGAVLFDGQDMGAMRDEVRAKLRLKAFGFVFQQPYLLGYLTARENVLVAAGPKASNGLDQADSLLEKLGLGSKMHRLPHELSGGERQRVCVARALFGNPRAIFADEPTAALDHHNGEQVVDLLNDNRGTGSLIMVTHDPSMLAHADRVLKIMDGEIEEEIRTTK